jgi:hypothetical protein
VLDFARLPWHSGLTLDAQLRGSTRSGNTSAQGINSRPHATIDDAEHSAGRV